jgi:hypothetical protein
LFSLVSKARLKLRPLGTCTGFQIGCEEFGIELNDVSLTATPTGVSSTGDPLSIFEVPTPSAGATAAVTLAVPPLIPKPAEPKVKITNGSPAVLDVFRAFCTSAVVAMLGASLL